MNLLNNLKKLRKNKRATRNLLLFGAGVFIFLGGLAVLWLSSLRIPDFHSFENRKVVNSTQIYDRTGKVLLYDIHQDVKRTDVSFDQMSLYVKNATVAIEDSEFYTHGGIRLTSIARALVSNIFHIGIGGGGSTITQQLVKNTLLTQKRSYVRKVKEWVLAIKIDNSMPKDKILEAYLNEVPYGGSIYGVEAASKSYFGKDAKDLTLAESAYLASLPQSPTTLSPYGKNRDKLEARKNLVLGRMLTLKFITQDEYNQAKGEQVTFLPQSSQGIKAPHFVFFIKDYLVQKYGEEEVENGGLKVITTLDADLQAKGEQIVKEGALQNAKDWNGTNAALVAIDPTNGQILTMVGSRNYFDKDIDGNYNVATADRQPGSSFKPFIYATAFEKGFTPSTVLFDLPTEFQTTCDASGKALPGHSQSDCYMPQNYDGKYRGPMSLREALAQSINIPAVKLFYLTGLDDSIKTAQDLGISTLKDKSQYGLTLVIGGGEVTLLDMTSAYGVFANSGVKNPYTGILKVEDVGGHVLEEYEPKSQEVLPKNVALTLSDVLSDEPAREPTFGIHSSIYIPSQQVAVKTGTTNNNKDAWTIGYTPSIVVGVWAGNNDNKPMKKGGAALAGPIWNKFINEALKVVPSTPFEPADLSFEPGLKPILRGIWQGGQTIPIDSATGLSATDMTPPENIIEKVIGGGVHSILYWVDKKDITGPPPSNPSSDPQFNHWEIPVQKWAAAHGASYSPFVSGTGATAALTPNSAISSGSVVKIIEPKNGGTYPRDQRVSLLISKTGSNPITKIDIYINGVYMESNEPPFNFSFVPSELVNLQTSNQLRVIAADSASNRSEATVTFTVE